jgi:drug/metabolite transporter (DMT)-like permease
MRTHWLWLHFAIITTLAWGVWGALLDTPTEAGFPETLGYVVWSLTMIPPALVAMSLAKWKLDCDLRSVLFGCAAGFTGAGGQLILFKTVNIAPAYLVFPFIALSPLITIFLAAIIAGERASLRGAVGIALALLAGVLLSMESPEGQGETGLMWVVMAVTVLLAWGVQGFIISRANETMRAESIFFYMMATALVLSPVAWAMTDFSQTINWGLEGPYAAAAIHVLNAVGALLLVYAFRYGKAMIVAPLINAGAPAMTVFLSLILLRVIPEPWQGVGILLAIVAAGLMAIEGEKKIPTGQEV